MGKLVLRLPDGRTRDIPLDRERITIGRRADNDVCLPFPGVSAEHAAVVTILDDSFLEDLNSTNGTLVNGRSIAKHFLRDHDEIDIGRQVLVYVAGHFVAEPASAAATVAAVRANESAKGASSSSAALGDSVAEPARASLDPAAGVSDAPDRSHRVAEPAHGMGEAWASPARGGRVDTGALLPEPARAGSATAHESRERTSPGLPTLEVLEGAGAGRVVPIDRDVFVIGRVGRQVAAAMRTPDGLRLVHVEGDAPPRINGAALPEEGSLLALGDEIEIAEARLRFHPGR
jgi:predicted component of type VI protein secretion system